MDFSIVWTYWPFLARALLVTVVVSIASAGLALVLGLLAAVARIAGPFAVRAVLAFVIDSLRAIPVLVVLVWTFFAVPVLTGRSLNPLAAAILALGVHLAAYVAETVRAGLLSVRHGQRAAALAVGMTPHQALRVVILPQAVIRMLPNLASLMVFAIKDSAIASVIAVPELVRQTSVLIGSTYRSFEFTTTTLLLYFVLAWPVAFGITAAYRQLSHRGAS